MTNILIKISNFVHYFYREGGCLNLQPIFTIIFFTFRVGRGGILGKSANCQARLLLFSAQISKLNSQGLNSETKGAELTL